LASLSGEFGPSVSAPPGPIRNALSTPVSSLEIRTLRSGVTYACSGEESGGTLIEEIGALNDPSARTWKLV
jgi:hypothetical protein